MYILYFKRIMKIEIMMPDFFRYFRNVFFTLLVSGLLQVACTLGTPESSGENTKYPVDFTITKDVLLDKIKGGWAGQVIGCTYGGPTEFKFNGTMIQDYISIEWDENRMEWWYINGPGLYDDIYMDLTVLGIL